MSLEDQVTVFSVTLSDMTVALRLRAPCPLSIQIERERIPVQRYAGGLNSQKYMAGRTVLCIYSHAVIGDISLIVRLVEGAKLVQIRVKVVDK